MNKSYKILGTILDSGKLQANKKGNIKYLPADIYHLYLMSRQIDLPLKSIALTLANVHIYENNIENTHNLIAGNENVKFELNV